MSIEEALVSTDPEVIKIGRKTAKGKVTSKVNYLKNLLDDENLIDRDEINKRLLDIENNLEIFQQLQESYIENRSQIADEQAEAKLIQQEDKYQNEVIQKVISIKSTCKKRLVKMDSTVKSAEFEAAKTKLSNVKKDAVKVITTSDRDIKKSAQLVHRNLEHSFEFVNNKYVELKTTSKVTATDKEFITKERDLVRELQFKLEAIFLTEPEAELKPQLSDVAGPISDPSAKLSYAVKLQKMSCPSFSGSPRDFAQFKRNFNALVNVPGRNWYKFS